MTIPYLQEYIFESTEFIKKRKQNLQTKNCVGRIDEFYFCACGGNMGVD
jgi:hypothetical protein